MTMPKPPIVLNRIDPTYKATEVFILACNRDFCVCVLMCACPSQLHFADLLERYSSPMMVLDLTKHAEKREREVVVANEYRRAIDHLNSNAPPGESVPHVLDPFDVWIVH